MTADSRTLIVPHLDGEILQATGPVEELLLWLRPDPDDPDRAVLDPGGVFAAGADAIGVLRAALVSTPLVGLLASDGRWGHVEVQVFAVPTASLRDYGTAVAALVSGKSGLTDDVADYARSVGMTPGALVGAATRFCDLTALVSDGELEALRSPLARARSGAGRVVLTAVENAAFLQLCDRFVTAWHEGDSLARWMYGLGFTRHRASTSARSRPAAGQERPRQSNGFCR